ncbi:MAG: low molecular weight phosphotyrosine protein phosphatase [Gammaproteobacteria bacterium]|nr:MAG: low molecular weight phosphotyrosine protein phosphatase [Gammaproteobacteria bacterium]
MTRPIVLAVCLGNICRSPTAEAALREAADELGVELDVRSAGTGDWHVGHPPDPRMREAAAAQGLSLSGTAEQVDAASLDASHLVLAMDRSNLADLQRLAHVAQVSTDIRLFRDFDPEAGGDADVPDPYYGGPDGFVEVVRMVRRTSRQVVELIASGELGKR